MKRAVVTVRFEGSNKGYAFFTFEQYLQVGDKVVVECSTGMQVVTVASLGGDAKLATAYIIQKVDMDAFLEKKDSAIHFANIRRQLKERLAELRELEELKQYAAGDAQMTGLLEQYKTLTK